MKRLLQSLALMSAVLASACYPPNESAGCPAVGCANALRVLFEPPVAIDRVDVDVVYDGNSIVCMRDVTGAAPGPGTQSSPCSGLTNRLGERFAVAYLSLSGGYIRELGLEPIAKQVTVRVGRAGKAMREATFTPEYRDEPINDCTTCKRAEYVLR